MERTPCLLVPEVFPGRHAAHCSAQKLVRRGNVHLPVETRSTRARQASAEPPRATPSPLLSVWSRFYLRARPRPDTVRPCHGGFSPDPSSHIPVSFRVHTQAASGPVCCTRCPKHGTAASGGPTAAQWPNGWHGARPGVGASSSGARAPGWPRTVRAAAG